MNRFSQEIQEMNRMMTETVTLDDFFQSPGCKKSVIRFDKLVKAYEKNTGRKFTDLGDLNAWSCDIQGMPGFRHLRAARWNMGNLATAYRLWKREKKRGILP